MRRPSRPPRRLRASHDEHVPSLAVLQQWNSASQLPICVVEVAGKGLGVAARRGLPAGVVVAEYRFRIVKRAACSPGDYRVEAEFSQIQKFLAQLPEAQQAVVEKVYLLNLTHEEAASALEIPLGTLKSRLRLAMGKMRQLIGTEQ